MVDSHTSDDPGQSGESRESDQKPPVDQPDQSDQSDEMRGWMRYSPGSSRVR